MQGSRPGSRGKLITLGAGGAACEANTPMNLALEPWDVARARPFTGHDGLVTVRARNSADSTSVQPDSAAFFEAAASGAG